MNDTRYLCDVISNQLGEGSAVALSSIVSMEGSTPRERGSKMVIAAEGKTFSTVGGGLMEATAISESVKVLETGQSKFIGIDMTGSDTSSPDMICGGSVVMLLDYITDSGTNRKIFTQMGELIDKSQSFYFVMAYSKSVHDINVLGHCLLFANGRTIGDKVISERVMPALREERHNISSTDLLEMDGRKYVIDSIRGIKTVYCFGAGHVAIPTAHIASLTGFRVVVVDDREEYANQERFPDSDKVVVINDYNHALEGFEIDEDSFIVILTRGHRYDREVLEQSIKTNAGYIGMISSRKKRDSLYETLIRERIATVKDLERVHSPIGLSIGGETPEKIAVSIIAEMISERVKKSPLHMLS